jgi:hypothetical protein
MYGIIYIAAYVLVYYYLTATIITFYNYYDHDPFFLFISLFLNFISLSFFLAFFFG